METDLSFVQRRKAQRCGDIMNCMTASTEKLIPSFCAAEKKKVSTVKNNV
ncbi:hypothetical protein YC2023_017810 [Brassica napus]